MVSVNHLRFFVLTDFYASCRLEALTGSVLRIVHLDGRVLAVKLSPGDVIRPGDVRGVTDEGMPRLKNPVQRGQLCVRFQVRFPAPGSLTPESCLVCVFFFFFF